MSHQFISLFYTYQCLFQTTVARNRVSTVLLKQTNKSSGLVCFFFWPCTLFGICLYNLILFFLESYWSYYLSHHSSSSWHLKIAVDMYHQLIPNFFSPNNFQCHWFHTKQVLSKPDFLNFLRFVEFKERKRIVCKSNLINLSVKQIHLLIEKLMKCYRAACYYFFHCFQYYFILLDFFRCTSIQNYVYYQQNCQQTKSSSIGLSPLPSLLRRSSVGLKGKCNKRKINDEKDSYNKRFINMSQTYSECESPIGKRIW